MLLEPLEKDLHGDVRKLLKYYKIEYREDRMDKRTRTKKGWPDFLFAIRGHAVAWELKKDEKSGLSMDQKKLMVRLMDERNGWEVQVIYTFQQAAMLLESYLLSWT